MQSTKIIIFSRDRALQLDGVLKSLFFHCRDLDEQGNVNILYTTSNPQHQSQYNKLITEYLTYPFLEFTREIDFKTDLLNLIGHSEEVLFLVDDNIFVENFYLATLKKYLKAEKNSIAYSLRLGENTSYCYMLDCQQKIPNFHKKTENTLLFNWTVSEHDFGYPMDVSSSLFRVSDLLPILKEFKFSNPNTLEALLDSKKDYFLKDKPLLLCFEKSLTFCAPINKVQDVARKNRVGINPKQNPNYLSKCFSKGMRLDIKAYIGFTPKSCHQEVKLHYLHTQNSNTSASSFSLKRFFRKIIKLKYYYRMYKSKGKKAPRLLVKTTLFENKIPVTVGNKNYNSTKTQPLVSIIIPCFKQAEFLREAVESVIKQTYQHWECIIVNDGSPDNTSEVAQALIQEFSERNISLIKIHNSGPSMARNKGIEKSKGDYILPMDSDDALFPHALERYVSVLEKHPEISIVYSDRQDFGSSEKLIFAQDFNRSTLFRSNILSYCSMFRRKVWIDTNGYDPLPVYYEDWNFWISAIKHGHSAKHINGAVFQYRVKEQSAYIEAIERDAEFKAQIVLNHRDIYEKRIQDWAVKELHKHQITGKLVSIIVTTFNNPQMLKNALESINHQFYKSLEVIIVNNGGENIKSIIVGFKNLSIIHVDTAKRTGFTEARKIALTYAKGEFIAYLDEDNIFYPEHIQNLVIYLEKSGESVAYTSPLRVYREKRTNFLARILKGNINTSYLFWENQHFTPICSIMHRKKCLEEIGFFNEVSKTRNENYWELMLRNFNFLYIQKNTMEIRQKTGEKKDNLIKVRNKYLDYTT